jgi:anti-anti-sigma factor
LRFPVRKALEMTQPESPPVFAARVDVRNGVSRIALEGELGHATIPQFDRCLASAAAESNGRGPPHLLLDLRGLTFIDSSGLRAVLAAVDGVSEQGREFATVGVTDPVRRLLETNGSSRLLDGANALGLIETFTEPGDGRDAR